MSGGRYSWELLGSSLGIPAIWLMFCNLAIPAESPSPFLLYTHVLVLQPFGWDMLQGFYSGEACALAMPSRRDLSGVFGFAALG